MVQKFASSNNQQSRVVERISKNWSLMQLRNIIIVFNSDSLHAKLNSHYEAWSYKKKKYKNIKAYRKAV